MLSSIQSNGLTIVAGIGQSMKMKLLTGLSDIKTDIADRPMLYRPKHHERFILLEDINAVIWRKY